MNEYDFQSGDFLDSLFLPPPSYPDVPNTHSSINDGLTTNPSLQPSGLDPNESGSKNLTNLIVNNSLDVPADSSKSQSFPLNFYKEVNYEPNGYSMDTNQSSCVTANERTAEPEAQPETVTDVSTQESSQPEITITINNVVSSFSVGCHINLKRLAMEGVNAIYKRECGMVSMKLRKPYTTASIWSSGKISCTGATSEEEAKVAARKYSRILQKMKYRVRFAQFRVVNVLGTSSFPFGIKITTFSSNFKEASYEPELHPGVTFRMKEPKATLKVFSTGSITVTAPSVFNVQMAIQKIYPLVEKYRMEPREKKGSQLECGKLHLMPSNRGPRANKHRQNSYGKINYLDEDTSDDFDSDESQE